jgi:hypothetical protein
MKKKTLVLVALYVDDLLVIGNHLERIHIVEAVAKKKKMSDLGWVQKYLGIEFYYATNGSIILHQTNYAQDIL